MEVIPQIINAKVMHKRLFPKVNSFSYSVYYVALPLPGASMPTRYLSFHHKDHGAHDDTDCGEWARSILTQYGLNDLVKSIMLVTMPRVLGYVFNPVSFYLCLDADTSLRAVICEVHNTFGEQHNYLCARPDHAPLSPDEWLGTDKIFHVSPFLPRTGSYRFRFALQEKSFGVWIDYYDAAQNKQLLTSLTGTFSPLNSGSLRRAFWAHPLVTLKTIALIHWQAVKLFFKGIRYIAKPLQSEAKITTTHDLTKM